MLQCPRLTDAPVPLPLSRAEPSKPQVILALTGSFSLKDVIKSLNSLVALQKSLGGGGGAVEAGDGGLGLGCDHPGLVCIFRSEG